LRKKTDISVLVVFDELVCVAAVGTKGQTAGNQGNAFWLSNFSVLSKTVPTWRSDLGSTMQHLCVFLLILQINQYMKGRRHLVS
jgi:hypothetical protein